MQADLFDTGEGLDLLAVGNWVQTSYHTGPFLIIETSGPCTCPEYVASLDGDDTPSEAHFHMTLASPGHKRPSYLNGYRKDGTSVWSDDLVLQSQNPRTNS